MASSILFGEMILRMFEERRARVPAGPVNLPFVRDHDILSHIRLLILSYGCLSTHPLIGFCCFFSCRFKYSRVCINPAFVLVIRVFKRDTPIFDPKHWRPDRDQYPSRSSTIAKRCDVASLPLVRLDCQIGFCILECPIVYSSRHPMLNWLHPLQDPSQPVALSMR